METFTITSDINDDTQTLTILITPTYAQANCSFTADDFIDPFDDDDCINYDNTDGNGNIKLFLHFYENENPYLAYNDHFFNDNEIIDHFGNEIFNAIIALRPTNTITYY